MSNQFENAASYRWPDHPQCRFQKLSFKNEIYEKIEFEITDQKKRDTKAVYFGNCSAVDSIDIEIWKRFPNLNGLTFFRSNIPILKNIFTVDLKMLQYLNLSYNNIKILEAHVFDELVELKWIYLSTNEIEEILHPIFAKNKKLEVIRLYKNKIQTLHPNLFDGLPKLEQVDIQRNPTVDEVFYQPNIEMMNEKLKPLFDNYSLNYGNPNRVKELELVSL